MTRHLYEAVIRVEGYVDHEEGDDWEPPASTMFAQAVLAVLPDEVIVTRLAPPQQLVAVTVSRKKMNRVSRWPELVAEREARIRREQDNIAKHAEQRSVEREERE